MIWLSPTIPFVWCVEVWSHEGDSWNGTYREKGDTDKLFRITGKVQP